MKVTVLKVLADGNCSDGVTCPTLAVTDRGTNIVVGEVVTDPEALSALSIGPGEGAVEFPTSLLER